MEDTVIVIMLKNKNTGFLETELGSYTLEGGDNLIHNIFALEEESGVSVHMRLTTERDLEDWEFSAALDCYDTEVLLELCASAVEDETGYNPLWEVTFDFSKSGEAMEEKISRILKVHKEELSSVYEAIKDLKEEYS